MISKLKFLRKMNWIVSSFSKEIGQKVASFVGKPEKKKQKMVSNQKYLRQTQNSSRLNAKTKDAVTKNFDKNHTIVASEKFLGKKGTNLTKI